MKKMIAIAAAAMMAVSSVSAAAADILIKINGEEFTPKNALGQEVAPFIENGSTFLPVRAISEAVGKEVRYDAENDAVYIGELPTPEALNEYPWLKIGDMVFYESDYPAGYSTYSYSTEDYVLTDQLIRLAESLFSEEEIALAAEEVRANYEDWMKNGISEEMILSQGIFRRLDSECYFEGCVKLLDTYDFGEPSDDYYEDYVTVKHILTDKEKAAEVLKKLSEGVSFDDLIAEYNTDPGQTRDSSYTFTYGYMVKEFEEAAFALEEGEYTKEPVKSQFGYHIIERLPLNKADVSTDEYFSEKLMAMLPEAGKVTEVECEGEYIGEIAGVKVPTDLVGLVRANNMTEKIKTTAYIMLLCDYVVENGYVSEFEAASAEGMIFNSEDLIEFSNVMSKTAYERLIRSTAILDEVLDSKIKAGEIDEEELFAGFDEYFKTLEFKRYFDTRVFVDGKVIVPSDANGEYVKPKNVDGTVYVPVRAIVEALGMNAAWDHETKTVVITE